jgi:hypothetical protein
VPGRNGRLQLLLCRGLHNINFQASSLPWGKKRGMVEANRGSSLSNCSCSCSCPKAVSTFNTTQDSCSCSLTMGHMFSWRALPGASLPVTVHSLDRPTTLSECVPAHLNVTHTACRP